MPDKPKFTELRPEEFRTPRKRWHYGVRSWAGRWGWFCVEWDLWEWAFGFMVGIEPPCEDPCGLFQQDGWALTIGLHLGPLDISACFERREVDD